MNLPEDLPPQKKTTNTRLFIEVSCTVTKNWKQSKNPITEDLLNQKWYIHTMEYLAAVKRKKKKKRRRALHRGTKWIPCVESSLHMDITRWSILKSDWLYSLQPKVEKLYTVSKNKTGSWLWLRSWTPYHKFRLKLKKVGKTTRPFRYDLNQILTIMQWKWEIDLRD